MSAQRIVRVEGRGLPLRGDNIDTDRIVPARFLRAVTFEGLEAHLFEDDRAQRPDHPFSSAVYRGAAILIVGANFGCGSSREHAPQAIRRWGLRAVVGQSFSEIFFGNAVTIGLPCVTAAADAISALMNLAEADPSATLAVSLQDLQIEAMGRRWPIGQPAAAREAFVAGTWDATGLLLDRYHEVERVARGLPYIRGF